MKNLHINPTLVIATLLVSSCANVTFIGNRERVGIDAEFSGTSPTPAEILVGQSQHTIMAVPPKKPGGLQATHQGELLSAYSYFGVKQSAATTPEAGKKPTPANRFDVTIQGEVYTGRAANALTGSDSGAPIKSSSNQDEPLQKPAEISEGVSGAKAIARSAPARIADQESETGYKMTPNPSPEESRARVDSRETLLNAF